MVWAAALWCALAVLPTGTKAQESVRFFVDAVSMRGDDSAAATRVDLYTGISYADLTFRGTPDGFLATYEVRAEISVLDKRGYPASVIQSPLWEQSLREDTFEPTQSEDTYDYTTHSVSLAPGRYEVAFEFLDRNSGATALRERLIDVRDLSRSPAISDIVLLRGSDAETNTIFPRVTRAVASDGIAFGIYYELYTSEADSLDVITTVEPRHAGRSLFGMPVQEHEPSAVFSSTESMLLARGRRQVISQIPTSDLDVGEYVIRLELARRSGEVVDAVERAFFARWSGLASYLSDLDQAIDQLVYFAKSREIDHIRSGQTRAEKLRRFRDFWRERDPTPRTDRNERMEEYYFRIDYANRNFGSSEDGWKTDRGQVHVLHGFPDHVSRQPFRFDTEPWEVWYYYGIGRQFVFVDQTGFGDFELVVPIWDERTRIR